LTITTPRQFSLIAGGSKGIGYAIAEALAKRNYNLILVGRHAQALITAKNLLESHYKIEVKTIEIDISQPGASEIIAAWCNDQKVQLTMLCNVAGLGGKRDFLLLPLNDLQHMVSINIAAQMALCLSLLSLLEKNSPSYILNVASMAGFAPMPQKNMYSATKAAVIFFSYSLRSQLENKKISVSCLCPGPVFTKPEIKEDTISRLGWFGKLMAVDPGTVGEIAVRNTLAKKMIIIPGALSKVMSFFLRLLPRSIIVRIYSMVGQK
jgi:short-subunit dehydrogenase